jgi:hypothetical protein
VKRSRGLIILGARVVRALNAWSMMLERLEVLVGYFHHFA